MAPLGVDQTVPTLGGRGTARMLARKDPAITVRRRYSKAFKLGSVKLVTEQGYTIGGASRRLEVDRKSLHNWNGKLTPGYDTSADSDAGWDMPDDSKALRLELRRLRRDNEQLRLRTRPFKKRGLLREGAATKFAWIRRHRNRYPLTRIC